MLIAAVIIGLQFGINSAEAQRNNQRVIASQNVTTGSGRVVIDASKAKGAFRNIRLVNARGARISLRDARVVYHDGSFDRIGRAFSLRSGERTRLFDRTNKLKFVDKVIVDIRSVSRRRARNVRLELRGTQTRREARLTRRGGTISDPGDHDVLFGYRTVALDVDRDEIQIERDVGRFSHLRFSVHENDVFIRDVRIDYVDGSTQFIPFGTRIKKGASTEWVEVYSSRFIKKIVLIYRADRGNRRTARIEVTGQYAKNWLAPDGDGRKYNDGWVLLGAQTAGSIGYDTDTIRVGQNKGGFEQIRIKVLKRSITLRELRVAYADGRSQIFKLTRRVDPGETVGPLSLRRKNTAIQKIVAKYRSRIFIGKGKGTAMVEVWGRH